MSIILNRGKNLRAVIVWFRMCMMASCVLFVCNFELSAKGIAAIKDQTFHRDSSAKIISYNTVQNVGASVRFNFKGKRSVTYNRPERIRYVEFSPHVSVDILNDRAIAPYRINLKKMDEFIQLYPQSAVLLKNYRDMCSRSVANYDSQMVKYRGRWLTLADYSEMRNKQKGSEDLGSSKLKFDELTTTKGKVYKAVVVNEKTPAGISIMHMFGMATIPYELLPRDVQNTLGGFDAGKSRAYMLGIAEREKKRIQYQRGVQLKKQEIREQKEKLIKNTVDHRRQNAAKKNRRLGSLKVKARTVSTRTRKLSWSNTWGSLDDNIIVVHSGKKKEHRRVVGVDLRSSPGTQGGEYVVEMFWFGFPLDNKRKRYVCASSAGIITVPSGGSSNLAIASDYNYLAQQLLYLERDSAGGLWSGLYVKTWSGYTYAGWVLRVSDGEGRVISQVGAQPSFIRHIQQIPLPRKK